MNNQNPALSRTPLQSGLSSLRNSQFAIRSSILSRPGLFRITALFAVVLFASCGRGPETGPARDGYEWPERILTTEERRQEAAEKLSRTLALLKREQLCGLLIESAPDISWITAGGEPVAPLFVREDGRRFLLTTADEGAQLLDGDLKGMGYDLRVIRWESEKADREEALMNLSAGRPFAADSALSGVRTLDEEVAALRIPLTETEVRKYRWLGPMCAEAVESVCRQVRPGMTERGIEALVSYALLRHTIRPESVCVVTDARIRSDGAACTRDDRKLDKALLIKVCGQRWGLHISFTRMVHFGPVPEEMKKAAEAAAAINAGFWARTLPDAKADSIMRNAISDYSKAGFAGEWARCDQGGAIGYTALEWIATPGSNRTVSAGQAFSWCPTVWGVRVEDTMLLSAENLEILTRTPDWPVIESSALGRMYRSPGILVR